MYYLLFFGIFESFRPNLSTQLFEFVLIDAFVFIVLNKQISTNENLVEIGTYRTIVESLPFSRCK